MGVSRANFELYLGTFLLFHLRRGRWVVKSEFSKSHHMFHQESTCTPLVYIQCFWKRVRNSFYGQTFVILFIKPESCSSVLSSFDLQPRDKLLTTQPLFLLINNTDSGSLLLNTLLVRITWLAICVRYEMVKEYG